MAKNKLSASILEQCDCEIIAFLDTSSYLPNITNPILRVTFPNYTNPIDAVYNLEAVTLLKPEDFGHTSFPSGVYNFTMSVCPNDKTEYSFCWLNICNELKCISEFVCELDLCDDEETLEKILNVKYKLEIAQRLVKECSTKKAIEIFNIAKKELDQLINKSECDVC